MKKINLEKFADGALAEKFNIGFKDVLENIADINTESKKKRKLIVELTFDPDEERELSSVDIAVKTKLAPNKSANTKLMIGVDDGGQVIASEFKKQVQGQQYMKVDEEGKVDTEGLKIIRGRG
jgi:hypothetical protein